MRVSLVASCLAGLVGLALPAAPAHAGRGEITEQTPYTLSPGEVRIGVGDVALGLFGHDLLRRFEVGTRPLAWVPSLFALPSYDVRGKFELWRDPYLSLAVAAETMQVDLSRMLDDDDADGAPGPRQAAFRVTPLEGWAGLRLGGRVRLNAGAVYTLVQARGDTSETKLDELGGAIGTSSLQTRGNLDVMATRWLHVVAGGRWTAWQRQRAAVVAGESSEMVDVTNTTEAKIDHGAVSGKAWSASLELHVTLRHTNLRLGAEYGNYTVPVVNFVAAERGWMPVLDLYWRI